MLVQTDKKSLVKTLIHHRHLLSESVVWNVVDKPPMWGITSVVTAFSPLQFRDMTKLSVTNGRLSVHGRRCKNHMAVPI